MKNIINKYLNKTIDEEELKALSSWLKEDAKNRQYFKACIRENYLMDFWGLDRQDKNRLPGIFSARNNRRGLRTRLFTSSALLKYAAILVVAFGIFYGLFTYLGDKGTLDYEPEMITLKLGDGTVKELAEGDNAEIRDKMGNRLIKQQDSKLDYHTEREKKTDAAAGIFNELTVPRGRRFNVTLADGTEVFLNSETTLRFPVAFDGENTREVYIKGEGYFSVTRDEERPFLVHAEGMVVEVLGTRFNVRAYEDDGHIKTSLQKGSVQVSASDSPDKPVIITPGEAASYDQKEGTFSVDKVIIANDVAWTDNRLLFIQEPFSEVAKKIERSYGIRIINQYKELDTVRFYGDFDIRTESVEDVLKAFTAIEFFEYSMKDDVVTVKK